MKLIPSPQKLIPYALWEREGDDFLSGGCFGEGKATEFKKHGQGLPGEKMLDSQVSAPKLSTPTLPEIVLRLFCPGDGLRGIVRVRG